MNMLRLITLLMFASPVYAAAAEEPCDRAALLALREGAPELSAEPQFSPAQNERLRGNSLENNPLVMDGYRHRGVVDLQSRQAWIVQSGGVAGHVNWFGPLSIDPHKFSGCPMNRQPRPHQPPNASRALNPEP
jgi:hypothetical protein